MYTASMYVQYMYLHLRTTSCILYLYNSTEVYRVHILSVQYMYMYIHDSCTYFLRSVHYPSIKERQQVQAMEVNQVNTVFAARQILKVQVQVQVPYLSHLKMSKALQYYPLNLEGFNLRVVPA